MSTNAPHPVHVAQPEGHIDPVDMDPIGPGRPCSVAVKALEVGQGGFEGGPAVGANRHELTVLAQAVGQAEAAMTSAPRESPSAPNPATNRGRRRNRRNGKATSESRTAGAIPARHLAQPSATTGRWARLRGAAGGARGRRAGPSRAIGGDAGVEPGRRLAWAGDC